MPKVTIYNGAGRELGTFPGFTDVDVATAYAHANKYASIEQAEKLRFFSMERLVFVPYVEN